MSSNPPYLFLVFGFKYSFNQLILKISLEVISPHRGLGIKFYLLCFDIELCITQHTGN